MSAGSPVQAMRELLQNGNEDTFPPFRPGETERLVYLAHTVDGYERHPSEDQVEGEWWPWATLKEIREGGELSRFSTQDLLDVVFCQARANRHGGGYGDWDEIFYDIANEIRRRCIGGRNEDASQSQLLRAVAAIPHRPKKDPREINILDPACGSGHFLLYCFALMLVMYEEAYDDQDLGLALRTAYPRRTIYGGLYPDSSFVTTCTGSISTCVPRKSLPSPCGFAASMSIKRWGSRRIGTGSPARTSSAPSRCLERDTCFGSSWSS